MQSHKGCLSGNAAVLVIAKVSAQTVFDVLIVGCGNIAGGFDADRTNLTLPLTHAGAFSTNAAFRLVACVEPDAERQQTFMKRWNVPLSFANLEQALQHQLQPAVVSICSPTVAHVTTLEHALAMRPRAIFCEKPVTASSTQTLNLVRACDAANVLLAINYTRRWAPDVIRLKEQLEQGHWGKLRSLTGLYNKGILNNGGHMIDLVSMLAGPLKVLAAGVPIYDFWAEDPSIPALLQSDDAVSVTLSIADARDYAVFELHIVTERGVISMEAGGMNWRFRTCTDDEQFAGYRSLGQAAELPGEYPQAMRAAVTNLHEALTHGTALACTGQMALRTQRLCEEIQDAAKCAHGS